MPRIHSINWKALAAHVLPSRTSLLIPLAAGACFSLPAAATPFVLAYTDGQLSQSYANLQLYYANLTAVGLGSAYSLTASGAIDLGGMTSTTASIIKFAKSKSLPLYPTVSDFSDAFGGFDPAISRSINHSAAARATAVNNLLALAKNNGFAGIDLDFEAVAPADKASFTRFVGALSASLHANGLKLIISAPPKVSDAEPANLAGYDYTALGQLVDYFQVMSYDEVGPGWCSTGFNGNVWPGPEAGLDWQKKILSYAASRMPASKVLAGLPSYGYDYSTGKTVYWSAYARTIAAHNASSHEDAQSATPYATWGAVKNVADGVAWSPANAQAAFWYDDVQSIKTKSALVAAYGLGGTSVWAMGYEDANFWSALQSGLKNGAPTSIILSASAGNGGTISPLGATPVRQGDNQAFSIKPNPGYTISAVSADGAAVGKVSSYAFYNVQTAHHLTASFISSPNQLEHNIEALATGYIWRKNANALTDTNRLASPGINDGQLGAGVTLNPEGEGGLAKWQAAGLLWPVAKTISSVKFINGKLDGEGNGYFQSNVSLQLSTNGSTWIESGWTLSPAYPGNGNAAGQSYTFTGAVTSGIFGVRIAGKTGTDSWSAIVKEVQVLGH
ncbi:spore germination protein YaaH [Oxalobacteraceae bacterium GrIS 1.11]